MNEKSYRIRFIDYILVYLLIFISNAYVLSQYSGTIRMMMYLILISILILSNINNVIIKRKCFIIYCVVMSNIIITVLINSEDAEQMLLNISLFSVAYVYATIYDYDRFIIIFVQIIYFLSVVSLILYFMTLIAPEIVMKLPSEYNIQGKPVYNMFFSTININNYLIRNQGIFWEPGAFQTFINLALIFNLFYFKDIKIRNIIILTITLFTTYSTTGYIVGSGILMVFLINSRKNIRDNKSKNINSIMIIMVVIFISMAYAYMIIPEAAKYQLFGKLSAYLDNINDGDVTSTSIRIDAIKTSLKYFIKRPLFGNGNIGMRNIAFESGYKMNTATMLNWFSMFGIIMGTIMNYGIYRMTNYFSVCTKMKIILWLLIIMSFMSEDYVRNPSIIVFVFLGYNNIGLHRNKFKKLI